MRRSLVLLLVILWWGPVPAWATEADAATKLGRGLQNAALGWFEIVNEIGAESDRRGLWIGIPSGMIRGGVFAVARTMAGIYEAVTFPLPNGKKEYDAILLPESVFKRR